MIASYQKYQSVLSEYTLTLLFACVFPNLSGLVHLTGKSSIKSTIMAAQHWAWLMPTMKNTSNQWLPDTLSGPLTSRPPCGPRSRQPLTTTCHERYIHVPVASQHLILSRSCVTVSLGFACSDTLKKSTNLVINLQVYMKRLLVSL